MGSRDTTRFTERITSDGDHGLTARVGTPTGPAIIREWLSRALAHGEAGSIAQPDIAEALKLIEER
jgi:hypothetical protein